MKATTLNSIAIMILGIGLIIHTFGVSERMDRLTNVIKAVERSSIFRDKDARICEWSDSDTEFVMKDPPAGSQFKSRGMLQSGGSFLCYD